MRKLPKDPSPIVKLKGQHDTIVIMCPGPSLSEEQVEMVKCTGHYTIIVGDAVLKYPEANIMYHCDARYWHYYDGMPNFKGDLRISLEDTRLPEVHRVVKAPLRKGIETVAPLVVTGGNSGYQAINLAIHFKPKKIILLGYDMKLGYSGEYSVRGEHPEKIRGSRNFTKDIERMGWLEEPLKKLGIKVYNCSTNTALTCFPVMDLKDVL